MNPVDLASSRFREIRKAEEQIRKKETAHTAAMARLEELRAQVGAAERRDRERLGEALIRGSCEPESKAEAIRAETAQQELRVEALRLAVDKAHGQIRKLVDEHRDNWRSRSMRDLANAKGRYAAAIEELEAARAGLSDTATLNSWIDSGEMSEASTDSLAGRTGVDASAKPVLAFSRALEELRLDCERLAAYPDTPPRRPGA
jgi:hypothetical protein